MENKKLTFEDVREEQRQRSKHPEYGECTDVRLSLGPSATPENVREELARLNAKSDEYHSFPAIDREKAKVHRHRKELETIWRLADTKLRQETPDVDGFLRELFPYVDIMPDVVMEDDLEYLRNRSRPFKKLR